MELASNIDVFIDILSPLAAFSTSSCVVGTGAGGASDAVQREQHEHEQEQQRQHQLAGPITNSSSSRSEEPTVAAPAATITTTVVGDGEWGTSPVNPQSRIDSLTPRQMTLLTQQRRQQSQWRLDGADVDARRFFAVPVFALDGAPLRIDVYVPPLEEYPPQLREWLNPEAVIFAKKKSGSRISELAICRHLVRALEAWSAMMLLAGYDVEREYRSLPFGSQVIVANMAADVAEMEIFLCPNYDVEQSMLSVDKLQEMWHLPEDGQGGWPPVLDLSQLKFRRQLHEAITVVQVSNGDDDEKEWVFKSLTRDLRYMYNELKMLLTLPTHPNVIPRPAYVVTKKGRFGGRHGVCGFVIEYLPLGSLKQRFLDASEGAAPAVTLQERFRWSRQVADALVHINSASPIGFYPDLKPDNVVLRARSVVDDKSSAARVELDAVLLDLEQRGGWFSWSPPEVVYVEYLEILAGGLGEEYADLRDEIAQKLGEYMPGWTPGSQNDRYQNLDGGFSGPWKALLEGRRKMRENSDGERGDDMLDNAQVFMLGKLIWCIFEGEALIRCGIDQELLQDNVPDSANSVSVAKTPAVFPEFRIAPAEIRELVRSCTAGAPEWEGRRRGVVVRGSRLVPAGGAHLDSKNKVWEVTEEETRAVAKEWWANEVNQARAFLQEVLDAAPSGSGRGLLGKINTRPTLANVRGDLLRLESQARHGIGG